MKELIQFCRERGTPKLRNASVQALTLYLAWAIQRRSLTVVEEGSQIVAVGIAWPVRDEGRIMADPTWQPMRAAVPESHLLYVANLTAPDPESRQRLIEWASLRWPMVREFCGHRERQSGNRFVRYPLRHIARFYAHA